LVDRRLVPKGSEFEKLAYSFPVLQVVCLSKITLSQTGFHRSKDE